MSAWRFDYRAPGAYEVLGRDMLVRRRCLRAGERELLSSSLVYFLPLRPPPLPPRKVSLKCPGCLFFVLTPQGYFEERRLTGLIFLIWAELRFKARGKPKTGELGDFRVISTLQL